MYSAWPAALISGIATAVAVPIGVVFQLTKSSTPDPLPVTFIVGSMAITALVAGVFIVLAVRGGLLLACCSRLPVGFALIIAAVNVAVFGILGAAPVETYAIKLDMPSSQSSHVEVPLLFWLIVVAAILVPVAVAYFAGRIARGRANAASRRRFLPGRYRQS
jgi:hypothetical protein